MRIRKRITFSNLIVLLALFIALGGTVYAASKINGKQIKTGSIPGNRIKKNSLTGNQINEGSLKSVVTYVTATATIPNTGAPTAVTATCPAGQKAVGGGSTDNTTTRNAFVNDMNFSSGGTGYTAFWEQFTGTPESVTTTATCIPAA